MNALVLQCGGPTAVVNTTLAALVRRWRSASQGTLLGGSYGLAALPAGTWRTLSPPPDGTDRDTRLAALDTTPGMALGGGRDRLREADVDAAVARLQATGVDTLFLIGGNGTMAAGRALAARAGDLGAPLRIVAVPKTIDNDIPCTDMCPGYPSAARFLVDAVRDVAADVSSMRGYEDVVLVETMGRHAGWLAAATRLAQSAPGDAPHIVLLPERPVQVSAVLEEIRAQHARDRICLVTVAEGVRDEEGVFLAERGPDHDVERDASGQVILGRSGGPLPYLAALVRERLALRCRLVRPDVLQRCSRAHVSPLDRSLAAMAGTAAVDLAAGATIDRPIMVSLRQREGVWGTEAVPLADVRGERTLPVALQVDARELRSLLT